MGEVDLYNLAPVFQLMAVGLAVAAVPLGWWLWQQRSATPSGRLRALTLITLFLTFDLVLFGAFTRLTDSGLGCPDWPGCYGSATPIGAKSEISAAQTAMPTGPVTHGKAWIEMVHRYLATGVGVLILTLASMTWWLRRASRGVSPWWPTFTLVWVCLQGAFGALTVTMKLFPAIVTLHLMFGIGLLALLMAQAVRYDGAGSRPLPAALYRGLWAGFALLWLQIALGGWVSTNYAVLACPDFPTCNGQWVPEMNWQGFSVWRELGYAPDGQLLPFVALSSIHFVHRSAAWLVLAVLVWCGWRLRLQPGLRSAGQWLLGLSALQFATGLSNVVLGWPLLAAVLHTGGAAAMVITLTWALSISRAEAFSRSPISPRPAA
ncbi:heme A synthase [Limnohabitans sp.]|jgi:cytochrome c oxidase assembly protein subunit 15|uniref:heme A synthase n=1 Tax=Limnohabitans sp. TaxID=1907725 RepID=UPI0037BF69F8